jgi:hypothetical protein
MGYGLYAQSWFWGVAGAIGLAFAVIQPANHLERHLKRRLMGAAK